MLLMRLAVHILVLIVLCSAALVPAAEVPRNASTDRPYGIDKRIPWTTSRVVGSPNPPLPFRAKKAFPKLKILCPIAIAREPGSNRLLIINQSAAWSGASKIYRIPDEPNAEQL